MEIENKNTNFEISVSSLEDLIKYEGSFDNYKIQGTLCKSSLETQYSIDTLIKNINIPFNEYCVNIILEKLKSELNAQ